ncbi:MAG: 16S rRNA (uracil(1498)-N(3))-methyltransferase [Bacteroidales bacterium]|jgi:16S rRNA (uracil1498-N3)-methyltransferase|nr:16S rRNA (uracil(1498)-N(3))-methyltransferase [Bacteroidales bacterium]
MPYFFQEDLSQDSFILAAKEAKHISKSMRLKEEDNIWITDGKGTRAKAALTSVRKEGCEVKIEERSFIEQSHINRFHLVVAPTKNPNRMEWLVEKAVEIGVSKITFVICERSERKYVELNRLQRISIAALKQSQGVWLPEIIVVPFSQFIKESAQFNADKFTACCDDKIPTIHISDIKYDFKEVVFLIGPEGDFTPQEVELAMAQGFQPVTLGEKILRTETAALFVACCCAAMKKSSFITSKYHCLHKE